MGSLDVEALRADTPGCESVVHLNNAGSALPPACVVDRVISHLQAEATFGGYEAQAEAGDELDAVYDALAALIGAHPHQIAVVENATRGWDMAFYALARRFSSGDRILTTTGEYGSNLAAFAQVTEHTGASVHVLPDDGSGELDLDALDRELERGAAYVAINHLPTPDGLRSWKHSPSTTVHPSDPTGPFTAGWDGLAIAPGRLDRAGLRGLEDQLADPVHRSGVVG